MPSEIRVTVDVVAFSVQQSSLEVLLIKRKYDPFRSSWALPGGFITDEDSSVEDAALRELLEETNVSKTHLEQLYTFGDRGRDPRGRVVTIAHLALMRAQDAELKASTDASGVAWWPMSDLPPLAFDHIEIIDYAFQRLKYKIEYTAAAFNLLPDKFTLRELQNVYEVILEREIDNRNFRKKLLALEIVEELDEMTQQMSHRPARLYRFSRKKFENLPDKPFFLF
jgi:ADP-ribose pyrophosphatase